MTQIDPSLDVKSREIRVFLSSTFRDMDAERNYLMTYVFPEVRRYCNERQVAFTEIDLRWGVTEEESKAGRTVEVCLEEIDRCREYPPFFIGFLGERYGWVPQPTDMQAWQESNADSPYMDEIRAGLQQGISVTELEMQYAFLKYRNAVEYSRVFLRSALETKRLYEQTLITSNANTPVTEEDFYDAANGKLTALKEQLRQSQCLSIDGYNSAEEFGEAIKQFLLEAVDRLFPTGEYSSSELQTRAHRNYAQSRRKAYVPLEESRSSVLTTIEDAVRADAQNNTARHIAITGISGRGKSAFLADLEIQLSSQGWVFSHYTGADGNRSLENWLIRVLDALTQTGKLITDLPERIDERWQALYIALQEAQAGLNQPIYLLVDAVNQCNEADATSRLSKLKLPKSVVLITTTTQDIDEQYWIANNLPALNTKHRVQAVLSFLSGYRKELASDLVSRIACDQATSEPLFLRLLLEELRLHAKHETLTQLTSELLEKGDAKTLFASVLTAMDNDYKNSIHKELASHIVRLLAASRRGLRHEDLAKLVAVETDQHDPADNRPRLADAILSPLLARLENFCLRDDGRLYIMHDALLDVAFHDQEKLQHSRQQLIAYFDDESGHSVAERVHQYQALQDTNGLVSTLGQLNATLSLWEYEPLLLRLTLDQLGAGKSKATAACEEINQAWCKSIKLSLLLNYNKDIFSIWLMDNYYNILAKHFLHEVIAWRKIRSESESNNLATSLNNLAQLYQYEGSFSEAENLLLQAFELDESELRKNEGSSIQKEHYLSETKLNMALLYHKARRFDDAEKIYKNILNSWNKNPPVASAIVATYLNNLAGLYQDQNKISAAEKYFQQALTVRQSILPEFHPDVLNSIENLASLYKQKKDFNSAESLYRQVLSLRERTLQKEHPDIATTLNNLGNLYQESGKSNEAASCYQRALDIKKLTGHDEDLFYAECLINLAEIYKSKQEYAEPKVESLYLQALGIVEYLLPDSANVKAECLTRLAELYKYRRQMPEFEYYCIQAFEVCDFLHPVDYPKNIAICLNDLAINFKEKKDYCKSEKFSRKALEILTSQPDKLDSYRSIAAVLYNLASTYCDENYYKKAIPLFQEALVIWQALLYDGHSNIIICMKSLGDAHQKLGNTAEAQHYYRKGAEIAFNQNLAPNEEFDIVSRVQRLALWYRDQKRLEEAESLYFYTLTICQDLLQDESSDSLYIKNIIAQTSYELGEMYQDKEQIDESKKFYKIGLTNWQELLQHSYPSTENTTDNIALTLYNIASIYKYENNLEKANSYYARAYEAWSSILNSGCYDKSITTTDMASCLSARGVIFQELGDLSNAEILYINSIKLIENLEPSISLSLNDIKVLLSELLNNLSGLFHVQKRFSESESLYKYALTIIQDTFPAGHIINATLLDGLGDLYKSQEKCQEAEILYFKALEVRKDNLPDSHPDLIISLVKLSLLKK